MTNIIHQLKISWLKSGLSKLKELKFKDSLIDLQNFTIEKSHSTTTIHYNVYSPPDIVLSSTENEVILSDVIELPFETYLKQSITAKKEFEILFQCVILFYLAEKDVNFLFNSDFTAVKATTSIEEKNYYFNYISVKTAFILDIRESTIYTTSLHAIKGINFKTMIKFGALDII